MHFFKKKYFLFIILLSSFSLYSMELLEHTHEESNIEYTSQELNEDLTLLFKRTYSKHLDSVYITNYYDPFEDENKEVTSCFMLPPSAIPSSSSSRSLNFHEPLKKRQKTFLDEILNTSFYDIKEDKKKKGSLIPQQLLTLFFLSNSIQKIVFNEFFEITFQELSRLDNSIDNGKRLSNTLKKENVTGEWIAEQLWSNKNILKRNIQTQSNYCAICDAFSEKPATSSCCTTKKLIDACRLINKELKNNALSKKIQVSSTKNVCIIIGAVSTEIEEAFSTLKVQWRRGKK